MARCASRAFFYWRHDMTREGDRVRRRILRAIRFETTYKRCSSCKEKKPKVLPVGAVQMCEDCLARRMANYPRARQ